MALSQPLLDLYGNNVTIFSAAKLSRLEVLAFVVMVAIVPALVAAAIDAFSRLFGPRVNESTRLVLLGTLSMMLGLAIARWLDVPGDIPAVVLAIAVGVGLPWAFDRSRSVREWSRWLSILAVAVVGNAALQLQPVLGDVNGARTDAVVAAPKVSVVHVVFDEFPLYALLDTDGNINAERYPNFARLASKSTWYRDAVAASNFTHQAVPALLSSVTPAKEGGPFLAEYPRNIFTLFRGKVDVRATEPVTSLCPEDVCAPANNINSSVDAKRFLRFIRDAGYVYGQRVLPPTLRKKIPSTDGAWGGFNAVADKFKEQFDGSALPQLDALVKAVRLHVADDQPRVSVAHVLAPHAPWRLTPDLRVTPQSKEINTKNPDDEDGVRDAYQAFLYQLGATDTALGEVIDTLEAAGRWDDTLLVVSADHGISFVPTMPQRHTDFSDMGQSNDIFRVPLFVKYPSQIAGTVSDCAVSNFDVLPTIVDVTKTTTSWSFEGQSLAGDCPQGRTRTMTSATGESAKFGKGFSDLAPRIRYYNSLVPHDGPISRVAAVGEAGGLVGTQVASAVVDPIATAWSLDQRRSFTSIAGGRGSSIPAQVTGTVTVTSPLPAGTEGIIAVDGVAAGVLGELTSEFADDSVTDIPFTAILDYTALGVGPHKVELYLRAPSGEVSRVND